MTLNLMFLCTETQKQMTMPAERPYCIETIECVRSITKFISIPQLLRHKVVHATVHMKNSQCNRKKRPQTLLSSIKNKI